MKISVTLHGIKYTAHADFEDIKSHDMMNLFVNILESHGYSKEWCKEVREKLDLPETLDCV